MRLVLPNDEGQNVYCSQELTDFIVNAPGSVVGDPTSSVGLTAVNGTGLTAVRADGAPALSQSINPTWTGTHTFSNNKDVTISNGNLILSGVGKGLSLRTGTNARVGKSTMTLGVATVANTSVTANTIILITKQDNTLLNLGTARAVPNPGTGFTITSSNLLDTSTYGWFLFEAV